MARTTIEELKKSRLADMSADERALFDNSHGATRLALDLGEKLREARGRPPTSASVSWPPVWAPVRPP